MPVSELITTIGAKTANSYDTLASFNQYLEDRANSATILAATDDTKKRALLQATQDLDQLAYVGIKYDPNIDTDGEPYQALEFPRHWMYQVDGLYIPKNVKHAQFEQAILIIKTESQSQDVGEGIDIHSFSRGGVSVTFREDRNLDDPQKKFYSQKAIQLLHDYLMRSQGTTLVR